MNSEGKPWRRIVLVDGLDFSNFVSGQSWQSHPADGCLMITCLCIQSCSTTLVNSMSLSLEVRPLKRHIQG